MYLSFFFKNIIFNPISKRNIAIKSLLNQQNYDTHVVESREINKDRSQKIPVETSIRYLKSSAYHQTYGNIPVWVPYRRNHKGSIPPKHTRRTCIRSEEISTGNPCPICRDEYLVLHELNVDLLKQFISPQTGVILGYSKTGLCRVKQLELEVCIKKAFDKGLLTYDVAFKKYDYSEYYPNYKNKNQ